VLLLERLVLAIAATAMAGVCRMSLRKAVHARRAEEDLQRRWAVVSCQSMLLPNAEQVLARQPGPAAEARRDVRLGDQSFTLVFGDEQAKANVNLLYRVGGLSGAERGVRRLVRGADVPIDLRPLPGRDRRSADDDQEPRAFESLGQVFGRTPPAALIDGAGRGPPSASVLTCWGGGVLHFGRAPDEAVREVCGRHAGAAQANLLVQVRAREPGITARQALEELKLTETAREALDELLADESGCHSLWVISRSGDRNWYDLAVADEWAEDGRPVMFSW
jgi:hypothetical protein